MRNPGQLLADEEGNKYIAYNKEQEPPMLAMGKLYVHFLEAGFKPVKDANGNPKKGLKAASKFKLIGFVD